MVFAIILTVLLFVGNYCLIVSATLWRQNQKGASYMMAAISVALYVLFCMLACGLLGLGQIRHFG